MHSNRRQARSDGIIATLNDEGAEAIREVGYNDDSFLDAWAS